VATARVIVDLNRQAQKIVEAAQKIGVEQNFLFLTTFKRYQVQLKILSDLEKELNESGLLITKEYVKGRQNLYSHPAINAYNKTADSANRTAGTLMKIITKLGDISLDDLSDDDEM
jgi:predicted secreted Zn-dependent protease